MKTLFITVLLVAAFDVQADEKKHAIIINCCSYHFDRDAGYNEINPGMAYRYSIDKSHSIIIGTYKNSENNWSELIGISKAWKLSKAFNFSLTAGLVDGYRNLDKEVINIFVVPTISYRDFIHVHVFPVDNGGAALSLTAMKW